MTLAACMWGARRLEHRGTAALDTPLRPNERKSLRCDHVAAVVGAIESTAITYCYARGKWLYVCFRLSCRSTIGRMFVSRPSCLAMFHGKKIAAGSRGRVFAPVREARAKRPGDFIPSGRASGRRRSFSIIYR
jgi:hypothetical protein